MLPFLLSALFAACAPVQQDSVKTAAAAIDIARKACSSEGSDTRGWQALYFDGRWDVRFVSGDPGGPPLFEVHVDARSGAVDHCETRLRE
jgi:hypothetical protein